MRKAADFRGFCGGVEPRGSDFGRRCGGTVARNRAGGTEHVTFDVGAAAFVGVRIAGGNVANADASNQRSRAGMGAAPSTNSNAPGLSAALRRFSASPAG